MKRNQGLDVMRGIAVLLVMEHHNLIKHSSLPIFFRWPLGLLQQGGYTGVHLFFVLSGFLVTTLFLVEFQRTGNVSPLRFLFRRAFKIYPAYYAFILPFYLVLPTADIPFRVILGDWIFFQNYLGSRWPHTWSLAVEEHFYVTLAALFAYFQYYGTLSRSIHRLPYAVTFLCCLTFVGKCMLLLLRPYQDEPYRIGTETHLTIEALFFGSLLSYLWCYHRNRVTDFTHTWCRPLWVLSVIGLLPAYCMRDTEWLLVLSYPLNYISYGVMILLALKVNEVSGVWAKALCWIGRYSYTIYLTHLPCAAFAAEAASQGKLSFSMGAVLYLSTSLLSGYMLATLVEKPALSLRENLYPRRATFTDRFK